eukprot:GHVR01093834.1.p1 GENE.GHVR01093834.1~~GHVR01093834.1.p1  ORF type:complete len:545 (+),score=184.59 GHVR01093834.1:130-1764(+)
MTEATENKKGDSDLLNEFVELRDRVQPPSTWKRNYNEKNPPLKEFTPRLKEVAKGMTLAYRLYKDGKKNREMGVKPWIEPFRKRIRHCDHGVPCGGLGAGSIGRGISGTFNRWNINPGLLEDISVPVNQFSVRISMPDGRVSTAVLNPLTGGDNKKRSFPYFCCQEPSQSQIELPSTWCAWSDAPSLSDPTPTPQSKKSSADQKRNHFQKQLQQTNYMARFPRAWTEYKNLFGSGVHLVCEQLSPFVPHNYSDSSLPVCLFKWYIKNTHTHSVSVSIMFTWQNGMDRDNSASGGHVQRPFTGRYSAAGMMFHHSVPCSSGVSQKTHKNQLTSLPDFDPLTFGISVLRDPTVECSICGAFDASGDGSDVWDIFSSTGHLHTHPDDINLNNNVPISKKGEILAGGVCGKVEVPPGATRSVTYSLSWDAPIARFPLGHSFQRRVCRYTQADLWRSNQTDVDNLVGMPSKKKATHTRIPTPTQNQVASPIPTHTQEDDLSLRPTSDETSKLAPHIPVKPHSKTHTHTHTHTQVRRTDTHTHTHTSKED